TGKMNQEQKQLVGHLREDGERLLKITGALLSISQVETGNILLNYQETKPLDVLDFALKTVKTQASQKHINIVVKAEENLPGIKADTDKTAWVLTNFLVNAIRYSPEKSDVIVEIKPENGSVRFSVQDFGRGIEAKFREKIFERYFQPGGQQGIGLALPISKEFIEAQGGKIGVESELGKGSMFFFKLMRVDES
ncbi:MAG: HAMP domain-containing sensor histidine kinase, partial [Bacteroidota bacterium]